MELSKVRQEIQARIETLEAEIEELRGVDASLEQADRILSRVDGGETAKPAKRSPAKPPSRGSSRVGTQTPKGQTRSRVLQAIREEGPRVRVNALTRATGISNGSVRYALARLEEDRMVTFEREGPQNVFVVLTPLGQGVEAEHGADNGAAAPEPA